MYKFLSKLLLLVLLLPTVSEAEEVIIGTGMYGDYAAFHNSNNYSWDESIYSKNSINMSGSITSVAYKCTLASPVTINSLKIYMGVTSRNIVASTNDFTPQHDLTLVYDGSDVVVGSETGWQTFQLDIPYYYENDKNLVVVISKSSELVTRNQKWNYTATANTNIYVESMADNSYCDYPTIQGRRSAIRSNITININPVTNVCPRPIDLQIANITPNSVTISWTPAEGTSSWDVYYSENGYSPNINTVPYASNISSNSYTFTNLIGGTHNRVFVRTNCGNGQYSNWVGLDAVTHPDLTGLGTYDNPYLIYTAHDMDAIAVSIASGWETSGKYFKLQANIDNVTKPIGDATHPFYGDFNGNNCTITLAINANGYAGLFGNVGVGANIHDIKTAGYVTSIANHAAGLVAFIDTNPISSIEDIHIVNCHNNADISGNFQNFGGIVGYYRGKIDQQNSHLYIEDCSNSGTISGNNTCHGGIAGYLLNYSYVDNCVNTGIISGTNNIGGISGRFYNYCTITNCANKGDVVATSNCGGIAGYNGASIIQNSYNIGNVSGSIAGGIAGFSDCGSLASYNLGFGFVENVYNAGNISSNNNNFSGSIIGRIYNTNSAIRLTINGAYYLDGTHQNNNPYGPGSTVNYTDIFYLSSFTQDENSNTVFNLADTCYGNTTDLLTALNNWRNDHDDFSEWLEDSYGNNRYYPTFEIGNISGLEINPSSVMMGKRPIGSWMKPEILTMSNTTQFPISLSNIDFAGSDFFVVYDTLGNNIDFPLTIESQETINVLLSNSNELIIPEGVVSGTLVAVWNEDRNVTTVSVSANAYLPTIPDVVETPMIVNDFPYNTTQLTTSIYNNYNLPGNNINGYDGVYKLVFTNDVLLNAEVYQGDNPKIALYAEDFQGQNGPDVNNYYTGPTILPTQYYLFDQSEMITHPAQGYNGADVSAICVGGSSMGWNVGWEIGGGQELILADDFVVEDNVTIEEMEFYGYQTNSGLESTITGLYMMVFDGNPAEGGNLIWNDNYTNMLTSTEWTGIYRASTNNILNNTAPIMRIVASGLDLNLAPGTYWVSMSLTGSITGGLYGSSGPWGVPRAILNEQYTGNGLHKIGTEWNPWMDVAQQGLPMIIRGVINDTELRSDNNVSFGGDNPIENLTVEAGTYYVVASSTSLQYKLNINPSQIPLPEPPTCIAPEDGSVDVSTPITLQWNLGNYTTEYQLLIGTTYPPSEIAVDWSDILMEDYRTDILLNNKNYFWRINERNSSGTTYGPVWGFTTSLNIPQDLEAADYELYEGETAELSWTAVIDRSYRGYNVYQDGVKINDDIITETNYNVEGLAYNMNGYNFNVTAVYDEGESGFSSNIVVRVSGNGTVSGVVYEQDSLTTIAGATVTFNGEDEYGVAQSFSFTTGNNGAYNGSILAGIYSGRANKDGYQGAINGNGVGITYNTNTPDVNFVMNEDYTPVGMVVAEEIDDNMVKIYWGQQQVAPVSEWLYYDDGTNVDAIGLTSGGSFYWGIMFPAATLQQYGTFSLTKVAYFDYSAHTGNILIYEGGASAPGTLIHTQAYTATGSSQFIEFDLTSALPINNAENLWIVMNNNDGQYVASACDNTGDANGRWISLDGIQWDDVAALGLNYTWNLRGFITDARGQVMTLSTSNREVVYKGQSTPGATIASDPEATTTVTNFGLNKTDDRSFQYYKLYRTNCYNEQYTEENTIVLASHITDTVYMDLSWADAEVGVYKWGVSIQYAGNRESAITWNQNTAITTMDGKPVVPQKSVMNKEFGKAPYTNVPKWIGNNRSEFSDAIVAQNTTLYHFTLNDPANLIGYGTNGAEFLNSSAYMNGMYYYATFTSGLFGTINPATGVLNNIATGVPYGGIEYNPVDGQLYGISLGTNATLYTINPTTGTATLVSTMSSTNDVLGMTITNDGRFLVIDAGIDGLSEINPLTGTILNSWPTGWTVNYGQDLGIDRETNIVYWAAYNATAGTAPLLQFDINTASYTTIGYFSTQTSCFATMTDSSINPGNNAIQDPGESAIVWSNCLDKDMVTTLDVAVATNSGDSPAGASVSFVNVSEPDMAISYEVELDETGIYTWEEVRKGTYVYTISLDGYTSCATADTIEIWDATSVECTLEEIIHSAGNLYVSPTGWAMWDGTGTGGPGSGSGDTFTESWDSGLNGWTNIDADGDGEVFYHSTECEPMHCVLPANPHSGAGHLCSESYCNCTYSALNPNNFLVTPQKYNIGNGSVFSFYACAQDASYAAEHFGVAISTSGNTNAADFTTIQEWTLTAKSGKDTKAGTTRNGGTRAGSWYQFTADLSEYAGQEVWIAIRHFNVSDQFLMCVDDAELASSRNTEAFEYYKVMLDGNFVANVETNYYQHDVTNLVEGQEYTTEVATVYSTGMSAWSEYTWTYVPCENFNGVTELVGEGVGGDAVLTWTMPNGGPTPPPSGGDTFFYDFEDGSLGDWTLIDADGDGINWLLGAAPGVSGNNGSGYCVYSESYRSVPLTPDNYFVSKQVTIGSGATFEFYACAQDASYAAEHYGVAISTTGNTNAADFTTIWEETMTAKGQQGGPRENRVQGTWYHKSIDLSAYAGQQVYIAVRHFNCTDMFYLDIDDIELTCNTKANLEGSWLSYDDGVNIDGIGTGGSAVYWAVMFPSNMMSAYEGYSMTKVNMFDREAFSGDVMIYQGGATAPETLVYTQDITMTGSNADVDIVLNEPVVLDVTQNVWVVMYCEYGGWPASCGANTGDPNGRWISLDGLQWDDVAALGLDYTWNLRAYVEEDGVTPPTPVGNILGSMIFRDGVCLTPSPIVEATYTDVAPGAGEYEYCVRVVYGAEEFVNDWYAMSCPECVNITVGGSSCPAPEDLYGEYTWNEDGTYGATLTWPYEAPVGPVEEWLYYDNGTYASSVGAGGTVYWGISFDAADLTAYAGCSLTQVALFDAYAGTYTLNVYYGGTSAPATLVHTQDLTLTGANDWNYATLTAALPLDASQPLWITFYNTGVTYPASGSTFTGDNNGAWVSIDGAEWMDISSASGGALSYTWMIRGFVTNQAKGGEIVALDAFKGEKSNSELSAIEVNPIVTEFATVNRDIDHFNIYRSTTNGNYAVIGQVPATATTYFDDCTGTPDEYYYQVTAVYADGCESEPAMAYTNPDDNYVMVDVTSVIENGIENVNIYPNPTNDKLNIEAAGMTRITVTSVLGQVMLDQAVASDNEVIDMNQYGAGVYMVRIVTEDGTMVKRVTVIE